MISPDGARAQMEGCITMGLGYVLSEEIRFKGGRILDINFDTYELPRFSWLPKIETVLVDNPEMPAQGAGEPPICNMGSVIANTVFNATGVRVFRLPMSPAQIKESLTGRGHQLNHNFLHTVFGNTSLAIQASAGRWKKARQELYRALFRYRQYD